MNISEWMFGKTPEAWVEQHGTQSPEQAAALKALLARLGQDEGGAAFPGEITAPLGDLEKLSLEALEQKILNQVQGTGPEAEAQTALSKMLQTGGAPVDFENYFKTAVADPTMRDFSETILPDLTRRFGSSGAFGSDRKLAEQQATERLGRTLVGGRSELAFKTQSDAANRVIAALGLSPEIAGGSMDSIIKGLTGASLPRTVEQAKLTGEYGEFQRQEQEKQKRIEQLLAALGIQTKQNVPLSTGATSGFVTPFLTSAFQGSVGQAAKGAGGFFGG